MKHCCFTCGLTDLDLKEMAEILSEEGYDGVEWRVTHPSEDAARKHLNLHDIESQAAEVKQLCDSLGLDIPVLASYEEMQNKERIERLFKLAKLLGARLVRVNPRFHEKKPHFDVLYEEAVEGIRGILPIAKEYGVRPILELHMGTIFPGPSDARRIVDHFRPEEIGLTLDPGNMVKEGIIDYRLGIEILGPNLAHVHVKNAGWFRNDDGSWRYEMCPVDSGIVDWPEVIRCLRETGYDGYFSQEDFYSFKHDPDKLNPDDKPKRIEYVRNVLRRNREYMEKCLEG